MDLTHEQIEEEYILVNSAREDPRNFSPLYDRYFEAIFNFIYRRTENEETCADLTSQTFLKALQNLKGYEFRGVPFSAWLFRIASNEVNKYYRKSKRKIIFSLEEERFREIIDDSELEYDEDDISEMTKLLNELPTDQLLALELRFYEGKNFREIAFILDISESAAKMRVYRILEKMRIQLESEKEG